MMCAFFYIHSMRYSVTVSIINFNSSAFTIRCVNSVFQTKGNVDLRVIVIDNDSHIEDFEKLNQALFGRPVQIIRSDSNLGFAGGHSLAAKHCTSEFFLVLNNDCLLEEDYISALCEFLSAHPKVALAIGQMQDWDGKPVRSFGYLPSLAYHLLGTSFAQFLHGKELFPAKIQYSQPVKVPYVSGSAMFFHFGHYRSVGGLDSGFFLYCEEEDIAIRLKKSGYGVYHLPNVYFRHYSGGSSESSYRLTREYYISFFLLLRKHYNFSYRVLYSLFLFVKLLKKGFKRRENLRLAFFMLVPHKSSYSIRGKK